MIPILFDVNETEFTSHGLGDLVDCDECTATQTQEGEYELAFTYPIGADLLNELTINRYVLAKANHYDRPQIFQIYGHEKTLDGKIQVNCQHISYNLSGIPTKPIAETASVQSVLSSMTQNAVVACPFTFETDVSEKPITENEKFKVDEPRSLRAILLDGDNSIFGSWNGDLVFDNFNVKFLKQAGEDRGTVLEYGVDITDLSLEENISEMITGVFPYFKDGNDDSPTYVYGDVQYAEGTFTKHIIAPLNVSEYFTEGTTPTKAQVEEKARAWMKTEKVGEPEITCTIAYADLKQDLRMYDAVKVRFPKMFIDVTAKVTSYTYDVLNERCTEIEVSNAKHSSKWSGLEDASRLKRGLLDPSRIGDKSIGGGKLGENSVSGYHLAPESVGETQLRVNSVSSEKFDSTVLANYKAGIIINSALNVNEGEITIVNKRLVVDSIQSGGNITCGAINGVYISKANGISFNGYDWTNWSEILPQ